MGRPAFKRPESVLVVVHTDDRVLLLERCAPPGFWQSVTGSLLPDETPLDCARRELVEETGFSPAGLRDLHLIQKFPIAVEWRHRYAPDVLENVEHAFALNLPGARRPDLNPGEHLAYRCLKAQRAIAAASSWTDRAAIRCALSLPAPPDA